MAKVLKLIGVLLFGFGMVAMAWPFVSVARLTGQVLDEVPTLPGVDVDEDRHAFSAMWNDDFELAARTYPAGQSADQVIDALGADFMRNGFTSGSFSGTATRSKTCCGDYDAVIVRTAEEPDGTVRQTITVFDSDVQSTYVLLAMLGLIFCGAGLAVLRINTDEHNDSSLGARSIVRDPHIYAH